MAFGSDKERDSAIATLAASLVGNKGNDGYDEDDLNTNRFAFTQFIWTVNSENLQLYTVHGRNTKNLPVVRAAIPRLIAALESEQAADAHILLMLIDGKTAYEPKRAAWEHWWQQVKNTEFVTGIEMRSRSTQGQGGVDLSLTPDPFADP